MGIKKRDSADSKRSPGRPLKKSIFTTKDTKNTKVYDALKILEMLCVLCVLAVRGFFSTFLE